MLGVAWRGNARLKHISIQSLIILDDEVIPLWAWHIDILGER
jgi:hypothetical protein